MLMTTTDLKVEYQVLGIVRGNRVKATHLGRDIVAGLKNLVGGDVKEYAELMTGVREAAMNDMIQEASNLGANAVIGIRFSSAQIAGGMAEIICYGTAVRI